MNNNVLNMVHLGQGMCAIMGWRTTQRKLNVEEHYNVIVCTVSPLYKYSRPLDPVTLFPRVQSALAGFFPSILLASCVSEDDGSGAGLTWDGLLFTILL